MISRVSHDTAQIFSYENRINPYTQLAFNLGQSSARHRNASHRYIIQMAFRWRADGGPILHAYRVLSENKKIFGNAFCPARIRQGANDGPTSISMSARCWSDVGFFLGSLVAGKWLPTSLNTCTSQHANSYSKTCLQRPLKKNTKSGFQYRVSLKCRTKVLQNAPRGAFCNTFDLH